MTPEIKANMLELMGFTRCETGKNIYYHRLIKDIPFFFNLEDPLEIITKEIFETGINYGHINL